MGATDNISARYACRCEYCGSGPPGVGKTHLAQSIGYEAIKQGFVVRYRSIFDLVRDFLADDALQQRDRVLQQYIKPDLVIIDDMGLRSLPKHLAEYLLEVIMRRYETRSTIMTSNRPLEDWGKLLQDVPTARAVLDRFLHHAQVIAITGESYRLKDAAVAKKPEKSMPDHHLTPRPLLKEREPLPLCAGCAAAHRSRGS